MNSPGSIAAKRRRTRDHYDRHPFGFDQPEILDEKLERRVMGEAIRAVKSDQRVVDVGCGRCRVAQLVQRTSGAQTVGVDLSLGSLRDAKRRDPGALVNGDNLALPLRSASADLVISNGVIHHTPDARASFRELARILRPGGTLVVSVYDRNSWYYPVWRYPGAVVRALQSWIGNAGLKITVFPLFHLAVLVLLPLATRRRLFIPVDTSWSLFHDQFTTPQCTFHTFDEIVEWAREADLECVETRREAAHQLATLKLTRPNR